MGKFVHVYKIAFQKGNHTGKTFQSKELNHGVRTLTTNYGSETVIPLYITGCREKIYSESAVFAKRRRLMRAIYFLPTAGDKKRYHRLKTVISLVSGVFLTLYGCRKVQ